MSLLNRIFMNLYNQPNLVWPPVICSNKVHIKISLVHWPSVTNAHLGRGSGYRAPEWKNWHGKLL